MRKSIKLNSAPDYVKLLKSAAQAYYNSEAPLMSDEEFDQIRDEFATKFPNHPYLEEVGTPELHPQFVKAKHKIPMGSQLKVNSPEEFTTWANKYAPSQELVWSEKEDGLSVSLVYQAGKLTQAVTRGNGIEGEDITSNVKKMKSVPQILSKKINADIRGEIILQKDIFAKHFQDKANARNAAAGTVRRLDGENCEYLDILAYDLIVDTPFKKLSEKFIELKVLGLMTPQWGVVSLPEEAIKIWQDYNLRLRNQQPYEMDGLVIEINDLKKQREVGMVDGRPHYARAFKFTAEIGETIILKDNWFPGRTGRITPVAEVKPVKLGGVTIVNVTLHNLSEVRKMGLKIGQRVSIKRAGDVIPKIIAALDNKGSDITPPTHCPSCNQPTQEEEIFLMCKNPNCPAKHYENLLHWVKSLEIKGLGEELVNQLREANLISDAGDFYELKKEQIAELDRRGEKSAEKVLKALHEKKTISFPVFIRGLGIINFSDKTAELIQPTFSTLKALSKAKAEELVKIKGVGEIVAQAIVEGMKEKKPLIDKLLKHISLLPYTPPAQGPLTGKSYCFTGFRDKVLEERIKAQGGKISSGVSKELTTLVVKDKTANSSKTKKALELGVILMDEKDLRAVLGE